MAKPFIDHANLVAGRLYVGQLEVNVTTRGADCGVRSFINLVLMASGGKVGPKTDADQARWTKAVRRWMKVPSGATTPADWVRAWRHPNLTKLFHKYGLNKPKLRRYDNADQALIPEGLAQGLTFEVGVVYGVLRSQGAPVGSSSFNLGHAIDLTGWMEHGDHFDLVDVDPLFDGRRHPYPHGPVRAQFQDFKLALSAFCLQVGRFDGISVELAKPLA